MGSAVCSYTCVVECAWNGGIIRHWAASLWRVYLWWNLRTLYLLACQVKVTASDAGLCCCVPCYTSAVCQALLTPFCGLILGLYHQTDWLLTITSATWPQDGHLTFRHMTLKTDVDLRHMTPETDRSLRGGVPRIQKSSGRLLGIQRPIIKDSIC